MRRTFQVTPLLALLALASSLTAAPLGTAFTYQGHLQDGSSPATGSYELKFTLFAVDSGGMAVAGAITNSPVSVSNGLFTTALDFGTGVFTGDARWLEVGVRTNGSTREFAALAPRQPLTPTPYAAYASGSDAAGLSGIIAPANIGKGFIQPDMLAIGAVTASRLAPGAVNHLDAPDGSPTNALMVSAAGLVGVGTNTPRAGLHVTTGATVLAPTWLSELVEDQAPYTNLWGISSLALAHNLLAVASSDNGSVTLVNIADPAAPVFKKSIMDGQGAFTNLYGATGVALNSSGGLMAVAALYENAVTLVNVSVPTVPLWNAVLRDGVGGFNDLAGARAVALTGDLLAIAAADDNAVTLVDVSNPASPVLRSVIKNGQFGFTNLAGAWALAQEGTLLAVAARTDDAVLLVDVANPASPVLRATLKNGVGSYTNLDYPRALAFSGNLLAIAAYGASAVTLVDVSNPAQPVLQASVKNGQGGFEHIGSPSSVQFQNKTLWIGSGGMVAAGFTAVDISNPAAPRLQAVVHRGAGVGFEKVESGKGLAVSGDVVVVASSSLYGLEAVTLLDGTTTAQAGVVSEARVGIGTAAPAAALHVVGDVLVESPNQVVLQALRVALGSSIASGHYSTAMGMSLASGDYSTAMGSLSEASGHYSTAMGDSTASGDYSTAVGDSTASGDYSTAMGVSTASGNYSTAMGDSTADGDYSTALGNSSASGYRATAMGSSTASGESSTALGLSTASGRYSVAMGYSCKATNYQSFALGIDAVARHQGAFVWSDGSATFTSPRSNSFCALASGGFEYYSGVGVGVRVAPGGNSWSAVSDRNLKENFQPVDAQAVLDKVCQLPITEWNLLTQPDTIRHLGPMAQDFAAAFGLGEDDRHISSSDADGVALAAIQGLNQKLEQQLKAKDTELQALRASVAELQQAVRHLNPASK